MHDDGHQHDHPPLLHPVLDGVRIEGDVRRVDMGDIFQFLRQLRSSPHGNCSGRSLIGHFFYYISQQKKVYLFT